MTPEELYEIWAPPGALWSPWAKPILFAQMYLSKRKPEPPPTPAPAPAQTLDGLMTPTPEQATPEAPESFDWAREYRHDTALVLDLPGEITVEAAMQLANLGFQPVPLYNCANSDLPVLVVPTVDIVTALARNAPLLSSISLPPDARPVFMLDSKRNTNVAPRPNEFDNRWVIFPQDFPSATFMKAQGITRVLIVQDQRKAMLSPEVQADLYEVARRWDGGGLDIMMREIKVPDSAPVSTGPKPFFASETDPVFRPLSFGPLSRFRLGAAGVAATLFAMAARRSSGGGFGHVIPDPTTTGGG